MYLVLFAIDLRNLYGISIALVIHSLDHSLFVRLILAGDVRGWCAGDLYRSRFSLL